MNGLPAATPSASLRLKSAKTRACSTRIWAACDERVVRLDRAVGQDFEDQPVEVGHLADARVLDDEVDLLDRREDRVDRDFAERVGLLRLRRAVATVAGDPEIHVEHGVGRGQRGDRLIGVDDVDLGRPGDVAGGHDPLAGAVAAHVEMRAHLAIHLDDPLEADPLEVQDDLGHVLADVVDRRELVPDAVDADARDRDAFERPQQDAAQGVAQRRAVAGLERLDLVAAVVQAGLDGFNAELRFLKQPESPPLMVTALGWSA